MTDWYLNEDGEVYPFDGDPDQQLEDFPNDDHTPYSSRREAERAADIARLKADIYRAKHPFTCAECGTTDSATYVVTTLDYDDPSTRTEVCRACDDRLRAEQHPRED